jgi:hypothetical protein
MTDATPRNEAARGAPGGSFNTSASSGARMTNHSAAAPVAQLLARLDGVRRTGRGWQAKCPSHPDRHASLSIGETDTGAALVHCFAGCDVHAICSAVGLSVSDLFPPRLVDRPQSRAESLELMRQRALWSVGAALPVLIDEATVLQIAAADIISGRPLDAGHLQRLKLAEQRIEDALTVLRPKLREVAA